ncbi:hypothetical protein RJT34_12904 [Clitoria ternatea]|uniref:Uncharacterized protein n=1 Tax=Clitoria ternatea TaxID=43366 RepID=A0AAN9JML6_CLITE
MHLVQSYYFERDGISHHHLLWFLRPGQLTIYLYVVFHFLSILNLFVSALFSLFASKEREMSSTLVG